MSLPLKLVQEFYVDKEGKRQNFGFPTADDVEIIKAEVKGISATLFCGNCKELKDIVLSQIDRTGRKEFEKVCPDCGNLLISELKNEICSKCEMGKFIILARWSA